MSYLTCFDFNSYFHKNFDIFQIVSLQQSSIHHLDRVNQLQTSSRFNTSDIHAQDHALDHQLNVNVDPEDAETQLSNSATTEYQHLVSTNIPPQQYITTESDVLILSGSMLKRIQRRRFNPNGEKPCCTFHKRRSLNLLEFCREKFT